MNGKVKFAGATKGMAINNATHRVNYILGEKENKLRDNNAEIWAEKVCDYAEALLKEMNNREMLK